MSLISGISIAGPTRRAYASHVNGHFDPNSLALYTTFYEAPPEETRLFAGLDAALFHHST